MSDRLQATQQHESRWRELRDDRDKLCGRIDPENLLLEIRRNEQTHIFDLRDYIDLLRGIALEENMC